MNLIVTILEQGLIYGILSLGLYITYKILDFPDLTVDGSFPLGAAVTAALITRGVNPYLTLPVAFAAGVLAGICTGLIHVKCKVRDLLSGIIMMTALWTMNLYIAGTANVPLFSQQSIFKNDFINGLPTGIKPYMTLILILVLTIICKILLDLYMQRFSDLLFQMDLSLWQAVYLLRRSECLRFLWEQEQWSLDLRASSLERVSLKRFHL